MATLVNTSMPSQEDKGQRNAGEVERRRDLVPDVAADSLSETGTQLPTTGLSRIRRDVVGNVTKDPEVNQGRPVGVYALLCTSATAEGLARGRACWAAGQIGKSAHPGQRVSAKDGLPVAGKVLGLGLARYWDRP